MNDAHYFDDERSLNLNTSTNAATFGYLSPTGHPTGHPAAYGYIPQDQAAAFPSGAPINPSRSNGEPFSTNYANKQRTYQVQQPSADQRRRAQSGASQQQTNFARSSLSPSYSFTSSPSPAPYSAGGVRTPYDQQEFNVIDEAFPTGYHSRNRSINALLNSTGNLSPYGHQSHPSSRVPDNQSDLRYRGSWGSMHRQRNPQASGIPQMVLNVPTSPTARPFPSYRETECVVPRMRPINHPSQLHPNVIRNPNNRRALPEGGFMSPLVALTCYLPSTYNLCDPKFEYNQAKNPRRVLTEPHEGIYNDGWDNNENDYILYVNDILGVEENRKYLTLNILGKGTFGQVVKCQNLLTKEVVAVKVIKNKPAFLNQSLMEVSILDHIQQTVDKHDRYNFLRLKDKFMHKGHLCLAFELLGSNLYEVIKKNNFKGLDITVVRTFVQQILVSLSALKSAQLVHCDLKPENILLKSNDSTKIKIIDFGSACHERQTVYTYIQSRFYRSPEVLLGLPYTSAIDMWSLGCIVAELFLGLPIFPGLSEFDQCSRILKSLGMPPNWMMSMGKNTKNFLVKLKDNTWRVRTLDEQNLAFNTHEKKGKEYFASQNIRTNIMNYPLPRHMSPEEINSEMLQREALSDFIYGLLNLNPFERWTPQQAALHPFVTGHKFTPRAMEPRSQVPIDLIPEVSRFPELIKSQKKISNLSSLRATEDRSHQELDIPQPQPAQGYTVPFPGAMGSSKIVAQNYQPYPPYPVQVQQAQAQAQQAQVQAQQAQAQAQHQQAQAQQAQVQAQHQQVPQSPMFQQPPQMPPVPVPPVPNTVRYPTQQTLPKQRKQNVKLMPQNLRMRSSTIGQVARNVPAPIQQAAARVDPQDMARNVNHPYPYMRDYFDEP